MSNVARFDNLKQIVQMIQPQFEDLAAIHKAVNYKREASFALQALTENDYLASMAISNQDSLKRAVINVAAIGLSLNPVLKLAYLVPRDKKVMLDLSYRGYIQLAIDCGAIKWAHADVVYEKDVFELRGLGIEPLHKFQPFGDRGKIIGTYCAAKTHDGDFITTIMTIEEVYSIRNRSQSWASGKNTPWKSDESEMIKKTVIRRAYKAWPMTDTRDNRFEQAIEVVNENDPVDFSLPAIVEDTNQKPNILDGIRQSLGYLERTEEKYISHLCTVNRREIKKLEDLTDLEISQAKIQLNQWVEQKRAKEEKKEVEDENTEPNK